MLIKKPDDIKSSEITDPQVYLNRRNFMRVAALAGTTAATALLYRQLNPPPPVLEQREKIADVITSHGNLVTVFPLTKTTSPTTSRIQ